MYGLCRSTRREHAFYEVSFGKNIDDQRTKPLRITPLRNTATPKWLAGQTHAMGKVVIDGPEDWITLITRVTKERKVNPSAPPPRSVLLGVQLVQVKIRNPK